jgi:hypothetical protein
MKEGPQVGIPIRDTLTDLFWKDVMLRAEKLGVGRTLHIEAYCEYVFFFSFFFFFTGNVLNNTDETITHIIQSISSRILWVRRRSSK